MNTYICPECGERQDDGEYRHPECCTHENPEVTDEADGVAFGGAAHHIVILCPDCGSHLGASEPDEDGRMYWVVVD